MVAQTAEEEVLERIAEGSPARQIPFLIMLENFRGMMGLWRQKNLDDHEYSKQVLGQETSAEPEEMGDISVAGDSHTENHYHYEGGQVKDNGALQKLLPIAAAAGLGAGALWLAENWPPWPTVPDTAYEVRFYNAEGELIEVPRHKEKP